MTGATDAGGVLRRVHDRLRDRAAAATDPRVTVGDRLVAVEARHPEAGDLAGVAHRPPTDEAGTWPVDVGDLAALAVAAPPEQHLRRAVGVAALAALSAPDVDWRAGDPMAGLPDDVAAVATVGLFRPALRKFDGCEVRVVERPAAGADDAPAGVSAVHPPAECDRAFEGADVCFVTGSTLVYGGLDRYLAAADDPAVVLVGATASVLPGPAFDAGVDVVAGARVTDPDAVRERVAAGDCATDLHGAGLQKCYVAADPPPPTLSPPEVERP